MMFSPSSYQKYKGIFLPYLSWEPGQAPRAKTLKYVGAPHIWVILQFLALRLVQQFFNYNSGFSTWTPISMVFSSWVSALVNPNFCIHLSVSIVLDAAICPVSSLLLQIQEELLNLCLTEPRRVAKFVSDQLFICWDRVATSKLYLCRTRNQSCAHFLVKRDVTWVLEDREDLEVKRKEKKLKEKVEANSHDILSANYQNYGFGRMPWKILSKSKEKGVIGTQLWLILKGVQQISKQLMFWVRLLSKICMVGLQKGL